MNNKELNNYCIDSFYQCQDCAFATLRNHSAKKYSTYCSQCDDQLLTWKLWYCPKYASTLSSEAAGKRIKGLNNEEGWI